MSIDEAIIALDESMPFVPKEKRSALTMAINVLFEKKKEKPHWMRVPDGSNWWACSSCGDAFLIDDMVDEYHYCPNCGEKMY